MLRWWSSIPSHCIRRYVAPTHLLDLELESKYLIIRARFSLSRFSPHAPTPLSEGPCRSTLAALQYDYKINFQFQGKVWFTLSGASNRVSSSIRFRFRPSGSRMDVSGNTSHTSGFNDDRSNLFKIFEGYNRRSAWNNMCYVHCIFISNFAYYSIFYLFFFP